jgi:hypothetical protein
VQTDFSVRRDQYHVSKSDGKRTEADGKSVLFYSREEGSGGKRSSCTLVAIFPSAFLLCQGPVQVLFKHCSFSCFT